MQPRFGVSLPALLLSLACSPSSRDANTPQPEDTANSEPPPVAPIESDANAPAPTPVDDGLERFEALVEIDAKPGGKRFQGVWLATGGVRWLISYRADPWWRHFEGREVRVAGERYDPQGQAIAADHFRVESMEIVEPTMDDEIISVSGKRELAGRFASYRWPAKTKLAGETSTVFDADDGTRYWLWDDAGLEPKPGKLARVEARIVEPSNFIARPGGPYLWIVDIEAAGE